MHEQRSPRQRSLPMPKRWPPLVSSPTRRSLAEVQWLIFATQGSPSSRDACEARHDPEAHCTILTSAWRRTFVDARFAGSSSDAARSFNPADLEGDRASCRNRLAKWDVETLRGDRQLHGCGRQADAAKTLDWNISEAVARPAGAAPKGGGYTQAHDGCDTASLQRHIDMVLQAQINQFQSLCREHGASWEAFGGERRELRHHRQHMDAMKEELAAQVAECANAQAVEDRDLEPAHQINEAVMSLARTFGARWKRSS